MSFQPSNCKLTENYRGNRFMCYLRFRSFTLYVHLGVVFLSAASALDLKLFSGHISIFYDLKYVCACVEREREIRVLQSQKSDRTINRIHFLGFTMKNDVRLEITEFLVLWVLNLRSLWISLEDFFFLILVLFWFLLAAFVFIFNFFFDCFRTTNFTWMPSAF